MTEFDTFITELYRLFGMIDGLFEIENERPVVRNLANQADTVEECYQEIRNRMTVTISDN